MPRRPDLWRTTSGDGVSNSNFPQPTGELDLRAEFDLLLYGDADHVSHGFPIVIRHMRRDAENKREPCTCLDEFSKDSDPDCSYCYGAGYLFDEQWHLTYRQYIGADGGLANRGVWTPPGEVRVDYTVFYFRYDVGLKYGDEIVEMKLDEEGEVVVPYVRTNIYRPRTIDYLRSDGGRIEYCAVYCREEDALRLELL